MCGCGTTNEPCYGCPCGCEHNPKYLHAIAVSEKRRVGWVESMDTIQRVRMLAYELRINHCNDELGKDWACFVSAEILKALDGKH